MNGIIALVLSMVAPGAGQVFNGDYWLGAALGGMFALGKTALLPLSVRVLRVQTEEGLLKLFYWFNWLYSLCVLFAIVQAGARGFGGAQSHPWTGVLSAFMIVAVFKNTHKEILFSALCGRRGLYEIIKPNRKSTSESQTSDGKTK